MIVPSKWASHLFCYFLAYFIQGAILGGLGPAMRVLTVSGALNVTAFSPIFSASGLGAVVGSIVANYFLPDLVHRGNILIAVMSFVVSAVLFLVPFVAQFGVGALTGLMVVKGCCVVLINASINKFCAVVEVDYPSIELAPRLNYSFAVGTVAGPLLAMVFVWWKNQVQWMFWTLGVINSLVMILALWTECPTSLASRDEAAKLLDGKEILTITPVLPSPLSGCVFLRIERESSIHSSPESFDETSAFIVLLGTLLTTMIAGVQCGLGAWLVEYIQSGGVHFIMPALISAMFWLSLLLGYCALRWLTKCLKLPKVLLLIESMTCTASSVILLIYSDCLYVKYGGILIYGFALSGIFSNCIDVLHSALNKAFIHHMSYLLMFSALCGEIYIPMLMAFFMGDYSGAVYGETAVMYITCILSFCMVVTVVLLLIAVQRKSILDAQESRNLNNFRSDE